MPGPTVSATPPSTLRIAVTAPTSLDPRDADTHDSLLVLSQIFDGLVSYDPETLDVVPAVAERWEVLDGGRRFVFRIRPGVTFHDGTPVTAASFVDAWNRLVDPVAARPYAFLLEPVAGFQKYQENLSVTGLSGVKALDERTLEVTLSRAWPDFVALLGHAALSPVPPSAAQPAFRGQPAGNGPYRVSTPLTPGVPLTLEASDGYYGVPAALPILEVNGVDVAENAWPAFVAGDLEVAEIPSPLFREAQGQFGERGVEPLARVLSCGFNESNERFADPALRTAVSLAVDREEIVEVVYGGVPLPATGIVPPILPGHAPDACGTNCAHDPDRAAELIRRIPKKERGFALDYASSPTGDRLAAEIASQLGEVGLPVTPRPHDEAGFGSVLKSGQHEMFCLAWTADYPRQQALLEPLLASGSPDNHGRVEDRRIDELLEEARTRGNPAVARGLYTQVERRALASMHAIPVVWFRSKLAVQTYVQGFDLSPLGLYEAASMSLGPGAPPEEAPEPVPEQPPGVPGLPGEGVPGEVEP
ncbi:MAG: ABC transporter substrate-binding protein [Actinomycetota bacterium]|nr:ABC transporter substrate-binding protein [Actinomycetota bacterium]